MLPLSSASIKNIRARGRSEAALDQTPCRHARHRRLAATCMAGARHQEGRAALLSCWHVPPHLTVTSHRTCDADEVPAVEPSLTAGVKCRCFFLKPGRRTQTAAEHKMKTAALTQRVAQRNAHRATQGHASRCPVSFSLQRKKFCGAARRGGPANPYRSRAAQLAVVSRGHPGGPTIPE